MNCCSSVNNLKARKTGNAVTRCTC